MAGQQRKQRMENPFRLVEAQEKCVLSGVASFYSIPVFVAGGEFPNFTTKNHNGIASACVPRDSNSSC